MPTTPLPGNRRLDADAGRLERERQVVAEPADALDAHAGRRQQLVAGHDGPALHVGDLGLDAELGQRLDQNPGGGRRVGLDARRFAAGTLVQQVERRQLVGRCAAARRGSTGRFAVSGSGVGLRRPARRFAACGSARAGAGSASGSSLAGGSSGAGLSAAAAGPLPAGLFAPIDLLQPSAARFSICRFLLLEALRARSWRAQRPLVPIRPTARDSPGHDEARDQRTRSATPADQHGRQPEQRPGHDPGAHRAEPADQQLAS